MKNIVGFALLSLVVIASSSVFAGNDDAQQNQAVAAKQSDSGSATGQILPWNQSTRPANSPWMPAQFIKHPELQRQYLATVATEKTTTASAEIK